MPCRTEYFEMTSSNQKSRVACRLYLPDGDIKAVLQLCHGMCEYTARYEGFAEAMCKNGIAVCGNDHLGHGDTAKANDDMKGFFGGAEGSYQYLIDDTHQLTQLVKNRFRNQKIFLLGHSMGSFVARLYLTRHGDIIDGAILSGTSGPNPLSGFAIAYARSVVRKKGERYLSKQLAALSRVGFLKRIPNAATPADWISSDADVVSRYVADPYCSYIFTASAYRDLFIMLDSCNRSGWYATVPKQLPILIISGEEDPVGAYGVGPRKVGERLTKAGVEDVTLGIYPTARHELLNEFVRGRVQNDIVAWLEERL